MVVDCIEQILNLFTLATQIFFSFRCLGMFNGIVYYLECILNKNKSYLICSNFMLVIMCTGDVEYLINFHELNSMEPSDRRSQKMI